MPHRVVPAALALTVLTLTAAAALHRHRKLQQALAREKAARRVSDAAWHRDIQAFDARLRAVLAAHHSTAGVLTEADQVLDTALAHHRTNPEGGPT